jgi:hypothetical protein
MIVLLHTMNLIMRNDAEGKQHVLLKIGDLYVMFTQM